MVLLIQNLVAVDSEHSAMSACIGAESASARAMTATSARWFIINVGNDLHCF